MSSMVRKQLMLDKDVEKKLAAEAKRIGVSQSSLMSFALDFYFNFRESKKNINCTKTKGEERGL